MRLIVALLVIGWGSFVWAAEDTAVDLSAPRQLCSAALKSLAEDDVEGALSVIGQAADLSTELANRSQDGLPAAAGGLYRKLTQLSADERFRLLHDWTMPTDDRPHVRLLVTPVPQEAPPKQFARVLRQRPRDTSFPIAAVNGVRGLFSSGWALVRAAEDAGELRRFARELQQLVERDVMHADQLLMLAKLADLRSDVAPIADHLDGRANSNPNSVPTVLGNGSLLALAAASLSREELRPASERALDALVKSPSAGHLRPFLRTAWAAAVQINRGESGVETLWRNRLKFWVPVSGKTVAADSNGAVATMWLAHEDHILHLAGAQQDVLLCRFPLSGEFEFHFETQAGGEMGTDGGLVYGGLQYEPLAANKLLNIWDAGRLHHLQLPCRFMRHSAEPVFNKMSIRIANNQPVFLTNLHPVWTDSTAAVASPWLGLSSSAANRPVFRNLQVTGKPVIPREVHLSAGSELRGWQSHVFGETQPPFTGVAQTMGTRLFFGFAALGWQLQNGEILAPKIPESTGARPQSLLRYQRPLLEDESIRYEFFYEPGETLAHPALGRLAFLLEEGGIRIRWLTNDDGDWTGLPVDNATVEPFNRRGPRPLPLKPQEWNKVEVTRAERKVKITLNDVLVYQRPLDFGGDHQFGLYRNRHESSVRVRKVVMTGDWPRELPQEFWDNPAARELGTLAVKDRRVTNRVVGQRFLAANARQIRSRARTLIGRDRYDYLAEWVLPGDGHEGFRLAGYFTQTDPSPAVLARRGGSTEGAEVLSPALDLLDVAFGLGLVADLRRRVETAEAPDLLDRKSQLALLALIDLQRGKPELAEESFAELQSVVPTIQQYSLSEVWPETLVVCRGMQRFPDNEAVRDLLEILYTRQTLRRKSWDLDHWHTRIGSLMALRDHTAIGGSQQSLGDVKLKDWIPVTRLRAKSRGDGHAHALWDQSPSGEIRHLAGHQEEYMLLSQPLRGNFEVEGDLRHTGSTQFLAGGRFFGASSNRERLIVGTFRSGANSFEVDPPFSKFGDWIRFRAVFREDHYTVFVNGRPVYEQELSPDYDPWLGGRWWWRNRGGVRNFRVTGQPQVPDAVVLSSSPDLSGWVSYHNSWTWRFQEDQRGNGQIVSVRRNKLSGSHSESLLAYHRPLIEDGSVEYEFLYNPGRNNVHPALDRLAFMVDPDGVKIHWITDGVFDRTGVPPDNMTLEAAAQRGPSQLPLREGKWNKAKLSVAGSLVRLELNGVLVCERELESSNRRTFGLFCFADRSTARVRKLVMRGDWPKELVPSVQGSTDQLVASLDEARDRLPARFRHDFAVGGIPDRFFVIHGARRGTRFVAHASGVEASVESPGRWQEGALVSTFSLQGDFDVEAAFEQAEVDECDKESSLTLAVNMGSDRKYVARMVRGRNLAGRQFLKGQLAVGNPDGTRRYIDRFETSEATSGRLRVARRGSEIYTMFAEADSDLFRVVNVQPASDRDVPVKGIQLKTIANGVSKVAVTWKSLTLRAERLALNPGSQQAEVRAISVMNLQTGREQVLAEPLPGFTLVGSPEWSTDGGKIAFDMSNGPTSTSRIVLVNADGSGVVDLGPGCMPSFSMDGQRLVHSQSGAGIVLMNVDGSDRRVIDRRGWGAQFSPASNLVAYVKARNIIVVSPSGDNERTLLRGDDVNRYTTIYWNFGWSPDGRFIAFKGRLRDNGKYELGVVSSDGAGRLTAAYQTPQNFNPDLTWAPNSDRVLFTLRSSGSGQFLSVDRRANATPQLFASQPKESHPYDCDWSPDGQRIAFSGGRPAALLEWTENNTP